VGCVAGEKRVDMYSTGGAVSGGEGLYWKYESWLKKMDYQLYSAIGAAGELFAIRTPLYEEMPEDTLLDDFMLSLRIAMKQYTIAYCDTAYALESGSTDMKEEEKRKIEESRMKEEQEKRRREKEKAEEEERIKNDRIRLFKQKQEEMIRRQMELEEEEMEKEREEEIEKERIKEQLLKIEEDKINRYQKYEEQQLMREIKTRMITDEDENKTEKEEEKERDDTLTTEEIIDNDRISVNDNKKEDFTKIEIDGINIKVNNSKRISIINNSIQLTINNLLEKYDVYLKVSI
jgi:hypothetical protein